MESKELILVNEENANSIMARIGGNSFLPKSIEWPKNKDGNNLILVASIPSSFIREYCSIDSSEDSYISIFSTYDKEDYFLDLITYHGIEEELENIKNGYTKVLIHEKSEARNESNNIIPARRIEPSVVINADSNSLGSKIGGKEGFLQKENLPLIDEFTFALQFYGSDFPDDYNDVFDLSDAVGYLFLKPNEGVFFVQTT